MNDNKGDALTADLIPTSSMADIAMLLIVFFVITATISADRGLDLALPPDEDAAVVDPIESVLVEVLRDGSLMVDERPLPLEQLVSYLAPKLARNPNKPVILRPRDDSPYGATVGVLDTLRMGEQEIGRVIQVALPTRREIDAMWR